MPDAVAYPVVIHRYRVMFTDGVSMDFLSHTADATFRGFAYECHYGKADDMSYRIAGIADLGAVYTYTPEEA